MEETPTLKSDKFNTDITINLILLIDCNLILLIDSFDLLSVIISFSVDRVTFTCKVESLHHFVTLIIFSTSYDLGSDFVQMLFFQPVTIWALTLPAASGRT